jgi:Rap guanine nucleotide exchange factor 1
MATIGELLPFRYSRSSSHSSLEQLAPPQPTSPSKQPKPSVVVEEDSPLNCLHWPPKFDSLIYLQNGEGALELRAGSVDELIVLAATTGAAASAVNGASRGQNRDYLYQDAFLLTYRTFIPTLELLAKLEHRFRRFSVDEDDVGQSGGGAGHDPGEAAARLRAARSAFSFLVSLIFQFAIFFD